MIRVSLKTPSKLFEDEAQVETVCSKSYALTEFTNQSNFKSYDELKTRLDVVLSGTVSVGNVAESMPEVKQKHSLHHNLQSHLLINRFSL